MTTVTVESLGSIWMIDEDQARYVRMPREDIERPQGDWPDPTGTGLEDLVWHEMRNWWISDVPVPVVLPDGRTGIHPYEACPLLVIDTVKSGIVLAPNATVRSQP